MKWWSLGFLGLVVCSGGFAAQEDGKALVERSCTKCHDLTATLKQHNTRERWSSIVDDMVARGAEGTDAELEKIIDYLAKTQGPKVSVNKASAQELARVLQVPIAAATAVVEYRDKNGKFKTIDDLKKVSALNGKDIDSKKELLDFSE